MSLNSVQRFLADLLDGLESPELPPAQAWVLPPSMTQPGAQPQIYVWGGTLTEARATLPREKGQKRVSHTISLYVQWMSPNDIAYEQHFPLLLDAIRATIRSVNLQQPITDATTGEVSWLTDLGEKMTLSYSTPVATNQQQYLQNTAVLKLPVTEWVHPA